MLITAIVLFAIAAVGGVTMAAMHFKGKTPPPVPLAVLHGLFAAAGLVVLIVGLLNAAGNLALTALVIFLIAAIGGFTLLTFHIRGRALPGGLVIGHGLLAVAAFVVLLAAVL